MPEIGGDAAVYADPDDPLALAEAIRGLALDDARREVMERSGPVRARQFDVALATTRLAALRREVLAARAVRIERLAPASI